MPVGGLHRVCQDVVRHRQPSPEILFIWSLCGCVLFLPNSHLVELFFMIRVGRVIDHLVGSGVVLAHPLFPPLQCR